MTEIERKYKKNSKQGIYFRYMLLLKRVYDFLRKINNIGYNEIKLEKKLKIAKQSIIVSRIERMILKKYFSFYDKYKDQIDDNFTFSNSYISYISDDHIVFVDISGDNDDRD